MRSIFGILCLWTNLAWSAVLVDFQVAQPPPLPKNARQCTHQLIDHTFGNSFGVPAITNYTPPTDCGPIGTWAGISLNLTVTSNGTQFDRLGVFTFHNAEIWRTSTPEPTIGDGIIWTYLKDVTRFIPLFVKAGEFVFELDNLLETGLDGQYATTVSATFFESSFANPPAKTADLILPITIPTPSVEDNIASVPPYVTFNLTFPVNTVEVYAELFPSGNGDEEFWYFNVANEFLNDLPSGTTFGDGPLREVRLLVDNMLAGVALPYPVIFTGGIIPTAWRPITSYGALDLPSYFVDLTPFVPILADGKPHNFTLSIASAESNHNINQNWFISGLVQVITDSSSRPTKGKITRNEAPLFAQTKTTGNVGADGDVNVTVEATHSVHIESQIISGSGKVNNVVWTQSLSYSNTQSYLDNTFVQNVFQTTTGTSLSTHNGVPSVKDIYSFPFNINLTVLTPDGSEFSAFFDHSYDRNILPAPFILGSTIAERQLSGGFFTVTNNGNFGNGTSNNSFSYSDTEGNTFNRKVDASLNNITFDHQSGSLAPSSLPHFPFFPKLQSPLSGAPRFPGKRFASSETP